MPSATEVHPMARSAREDVGRFRNPGIPSRLTFLLLCDSDKTCAFPRAPWLHHSAGLRRVLMVSAFIYRPTSAGLYVIRGIRCAEGALTFRSAGKKLASMELDASSRRCSPVKREALVGQAQYSPSQVAPEKCRIVGVQRDHQAGIEVAAHAGGLRAATQQPVRRLEVTQISSGICRSASRSINSCVVDRR